MKQLLGRFAQRITGRGPHGVAPFDSVEADLVRARATLAAGTWPDGALHAVEADRTVVAGSFALLGQQIPKPLRPAAQLSPVRRLFALRDACVAGDDGVVWCPHLGLAVEETVRQWHGGPDTHPLLSAPRYPVATPLPGVALNLGSLDAGGFYHFLHESFPRLALARKWLDHVDHFLCPGGPDSFHGGWLELAGVPAARIRWLHGHAHWRCEQLLFTNLPTDDCAPTLWLFGAIRELARWSPAPYPTRRLWLTRRDAPSRRLAWEDRLLALLPDFEPVSLARLPAAEQVALFASAAVVAGPGGAGFANLPFCHPNARVVELLSDLLPLPLYARLAAVAGLPHAWAIVDFQREPDDLPALAAAIRAFIS
jgi:hypothetical protein